MECKNCWWFKTTKKQKEKGQCLAYGVWVKPNSQICCDYERGMR